jgi:TatD DNase family protein
LITLSTNPLNARYSEAHCHVRSISDEAIERAVENGVALVLTAGIDMPSSEDAVVAAAKFGIVKGCVGIHPWYADDYNAENHVLLREMVGNPEMVAVSEIGLDYGGRMTKNWERSSEVIDHDIQRVAFQGQIDLAIELGLPHQQDWSRYPWAHQGSRILCSSGGAGSLPFHR